MPSGILLVIGIAALIYGAELLVRNASRLAAMFGLSPLVIGLTIVAFGTSAPELAIAAAGALSNHADTSLGNAVGSNIFNIFFVLGLVSIFSPLGVKKQIIKLDAPIMVGASLLFYYFIFDGVLTKSESAVLMALLVAYTSFTFFISKRENSAAREVQSADEQATRPAGTRPWLSAVLIVVGIVLLALGSDWTVTAATAMARTFGVSELVIGLTIVAIGTSLPELVTSLVAIRNREHDMAVGNIVGSCIFNILAVVPVMSLFASGDITISSAALTFDIPILLAAAIVSLPIFFTGYRISRWEGVLFLFWYLAYIAYVFLHTAEQEMLQSFERALVTIILPATVITLIVITWRSLKKEHFTS
ncbi:MAG: calcium/sodium antiporter [Candidatus Zixiibacteriota bacterium]